MVRVPRVPLTHSGSIVMTLSLLIFWFFSALGNFYSAHPAHRFAGAGEGRRMMLMLGPSCGAGKRWRKGQGKTLCC